MQRVEPTGRSPLRPRLVRALQIAASLVLLGLLWRVFDGAEAARRLVGADRRWLLAAFAALTLQTVLSALRWRLTAAQLGIVLDRSIAIREYYLSQIVNQALPGGVLGDAGRALRARAQAGLMASGQAVVFERLAGQAGLLAVLAVAFLATLAAPGGLQWPAWLVAPVAALVLGGIAVPVALWGAVHLAPVRIGRGLSGQVQAMARTLAAPGVRWRQLWLSLGTALCNVAALGFHAWDIGAALPVTTVLALAPLILFTMVIPITVSGWGLREAAAAALFPLAGAEPAAGLAASVAFGVVYLASVLPGIVLLAAKPAPAR